MDGPPNETILETIERRLVPDEQAKKARGEVFTPLALVRELLYGLRKSDLEAGTRTIWGVDADGTPVEDDPANRIGGLPLETWRDPDTKWIDPANGIGNFPFVAFAMLDFQLKTHGTKGSSSWTDAVRKTHIVEKMLYTIELDRGNVNTSYKVMDYLAPGAKPNVCCADTLKVTDEDLQRHFGVSKFDVVMGNPPFNAPREVKGQTSTLWDKFISYGLAILTPTGSLAFITPANWRRPDNKLYVDMTRTNQTSFLHIIGEQEARQLFGVGSRIDMYILNRTARSPVASVIDERGVLASLDLREFPFLPNYNFSAIRSILAPSPAEGIPVIFSSSIYEHRKKHVRREKTEDFIHPVVHSMTQSGIGFLYTNDTTKGHFGQPKVLLNVGRHQYPYNDHEGQYGMSQIVFGLPISSKEEGDLMVSAMNTDAFKEIIKATKWGMFQTDYRMFKYFRPDFYTQFLKKPTGGKRHITPRNPRRKP
jgi:hypothetical protein